MKMNKDCLKSAEMLPAGYLHRNNPSLTKTRNPTFRVSSLSVEAVEVEGAFVDVMECSGVETVAEVFHVERRASIVVIVTESTVAVDIEVVVGMGSVALGGMVGMVGMVGMDSLIKQANFVHLKIFLGMFF